MNKVNQPDPNDFKLGKVYQELLDIDDEMRLALVDGINKRIGIFKKAGLFEEVTQLKIAACQSRVMLLADIKMQIRKDLCDKDREAIPTTKPTYQKTIFQYFWKKLKRYTFSNLKSITMTTTQQPVDMELQKLLQNTHPSMYNGKSSTVINDIQDMRDSLNVYITQHLLALGKEKAIAATKEYKNLLILAHEMKHDLSKFEEKLRKRKL